jgi:tRNA A58 N-methylase Trm61
MVDERRARPADRMIAHTGFITVATRWQQPAPPAQTEEYSE